MSKPRMHLPGAVYLITNRCFQGRLFLLPTAQINFLVGYWFARALKHYGNGLEIYAFIFLSNHFHLLVRDNKGSLAPFMSYFQSNLAKEVNRILKRDGAVWQGHYDDQIIVGEDMFWEKFCYVTCNAVKAGLVDKAAEWIGWSSLPASLSGEPFQFTAVNRNRYNKACRNRKKKPQREKYKETYSVSLTPPFGFEERSVQERAAHIRNLVAQQERFHREMRGNKPALGIEAISKQKPTDRPKISARTPKKRFACKDKAVLGECLSQYKQFVARYRETYHQFKIAAETGNRFHNEWPVGSYPPSGKLRVAV